MSEIKVFHFNVFSLVPQFEPPCETYVQSQKRGFQRGHVEILALYKVFTKDIGIAERDVQVRMTGRLAADETVSNLVIRNYLVGDVAKMLETQIRLENNLPLLHLPVIIPQTNRCVMLNVVTSDRATSSGPRPKQIADKAPRLVEVNRPDVTQQHLDPRDALYPDTISSLNDEEAVLYIKTWIGSDTDNIIGAASYSCRPTCVKKILELGATVDRTTKHGMKQNVLEMALSSYYGTLEDRKEIVDLAIKRGVDFNQKVNYCGSDVTLCDMMDSKIKYLEQPWDGTRCVEAGANDAAIQMYQSLKAYLVQCGAK